MDYNTEIICEMLSIDPESIESAEVAAGDGGVEIRVDVAKVATSCPHCGSDDFWANEHRVRKIAHPVPIERRGEIPQEKRGITP